MRLVLVGDHVLAVRRAADARLGVPGQRRLGRAAGDRLLRGVQVDVVVVQGRLDVRGEVAGEP